MDPWTQLWYLVVWIATLKILQLAVYPHLRSSLHRYAYPAAYPVSLLILTLASWYCGQVHIPVQIAVIPFLVLAGYTLIRSPACYRDITKMASWDAIFSCGFLFALALRIVNPVISYFSEQFLNHAFIVTVMRNPVAPPVDPWFAGGVINVYYYLGHWMMGVLGILTGVPSQVVFNLALPTVVGICFVMLYAVGDLLIPRMKWLPVATLFIVPPAVLVYALQGDGLYTVLDKSVWTIANTRTEYPLFTMLLGDTHAFTIDWLNTCLFLFLLAYISLCWHKTGTTGRILLICLSVLSLGSMPPINTWDVLIYAPLLLVVGVILAVREWKGPEGVSRETIGFLIGVPAGAFCLYLPYYLELRSAGVSGLGFVSTHSTIMEFLLFNGFFAAFFIISLLPDIRRQPLLLIGTLPFLATGYVPAAIALIPVLYLVKRWKFEFHDLLAITGFLVIIICEFVHFEEALSGVAERWNTVYKLYATVWILLSVSMFVTIGRWLSGRSWLFSPSKGVVRVVSVVVAVVLVATPFVAQIDIGKGLLGIAYPDGYYTLDGFAYLDSYQPGDAEMIRFLTQIPGNPVIVEAFTGDYDYSSRISSLTGLQTILGRRNGHEFLYRGDTDGWYFYMPDDIKAIYEEPEKSLDVMRKYNATLLVVGDRERAVYDVNLPESGLSLIFDRNGSQIYRLDNDHPPPASLQGGERY